MLAKTAVQKQCSTIMAQSSRKAWFGLEGTPSSLRTSETGYGAVVADLVRQAAELFDEIEEQARGAETRAESLIRRLHSAEARSEEVERTGQRENLRGSRFKT